jgi:hypothetical protein
MKIAISILVYTAFIEPTIYLSYKNWSSILQLHTFLFSPFAVFFQIFIARHAVHRVTKRSPPSSGRASPPRWYILEPERDKLFLIAIASRDFTNRPHSSHHRYKFFGICAGYYRWQ